MKLLSRLAPFVFLACIASPAIACDRSPDLERIPGSTDAEAEARYSNYEKALDVIRSVETETSQIERSWIVFLAKVEKVVTSTQDSAATKITVKPVWQVRGLLPDGPTDITSTRAGSCGSPFDVTGVKKGNLLVVFEGPGSRQAIAAQSVISAELIDAIDMYALSVRGITRRRHL